MKKWLCLAKVKHLGMQMLVMNTIRKITSKLGYKDWSIGFTVIILLKRGLFSIQCK